MQIHRNCHCISIKQIKGLENQGNALPHHTHHMDMLYLPFPPTLVISLPGMNYRLAAHTIQAITAELGHGKLHNNIYKTMTGLTLTYCS
jgi:hypothetical protein